MRLFPFARQSRGVTTHYYSLQWPIALDLCFIAEAIRAGGCQHGIEGPWYITQVQLEVIQAAVHTAEAKGGLRGSHVASI